MKHILALWLLLVSLYVCPPLDAQCVRGNINVGHIFKSTGDPQLDGRFNEEAYMIYRVFNVRPNLLVFDDRGSPNAFALPAGPAGTVLFGIGLIKDELWHMSKGGHALAGVMAHEFAHILQFQAGCQLEGRNRELHADFLAGYYFARKAYFTQTNIAAFARSLFEKGDYNFWSESHHGTPDERVAAMIGGFSYGGQALPLVYSAGIMYLSSY